jgi:hypothetical protein
VDGKFRLATHTVRKPWIKITGKIIPILDRETQILQCK